MGNSDTMSGKDRYAKVYDLSKRLLRHRTTFFLGAGFSKNIDDDYPVFKAVGDRCKHFIDGLADAELRERAGKAAGDDSCKKLWESMEQLPSCLKESDWAFYERIWGDKKGEPWAAELLEYLYQSIRKSIIDEDALGESQISLKADRIFSLFVKTVILPERHLWSTDGVLERWRLRRLTRERPSPGQHTVTLLARLAAEGGSITAITFNFDPLVEVGGRLIGMDRRTWEPEDQAPGRWYWPATWVSVATEADAASHLSPSSGLEIIHPHGRIDPPCDRLIFTASQLTSWRGRATIGSLYSNALSYSRCVFIGLSLDDPVLYTTTTDLVGHLQLSRGATQLGRGSRSRGRRSGGASPGDTSANDRNPYWVIAKSVPRAIQMAGGLHLEPQQQLIEIKNKQGTIDPVAALLWLGMVGQQLLRTIAERAPADPKLGKEIALNLAVLEDVFTAREELPQIWTWWSRWNDAERWAGEIYECLPRLLLFHEILFPPEVSDGWTAFLLAETTANHDFYFPARTRPFRAMALLLLLVALGQLQQEGKITPVRVAPEWPGGLLTCVPSHRPGHWSPIRLLPILATCEDLRINGQDNSRRKSLRRWRVLAARQSDPAQRWIPVRPLLLVPANEDPTELGQREQWVEKLLEKSAASWEPKMTFLKQKSISVPEILRLIAGEKTSVFELRGE